MKTSVSRRQLLALLGVGASSGLSVDTLSPKEQPEKITVNIYTGADVYEEFPTPKIEAALETIQEVTTNALTQLTNAVDKAYTITVSIKSNQIPVSDFSAKTGETFVNDWESYIQSSSTITTDVTTNLVLTSEVILTGTAQISGYAEFPEDLGDSTAGLPSAVFGFEPTELAEYTAPAETTTETVGLDAEESLLAVVLHEVGHTLGFRHTMGSVTETDEQIIVSPMMGSYINSEELFSGDNYWDEPYPEISAVEEILAEKVVTLSYNPRLSQYLEPSF